MITFRLGNYSEQEKEIIANLIEFAQMGVCQLCQSTECLLKPEVKCPYRHLLDDLNRVEEKFRQT